ncbi:MAG: hypothetical protein M2R45_01642 [Verrucomicrobia subdivision 3 bacterium]|nr:hypothetical protein [Limisphaerales bacterium]MCS1412793.1 hypothetical protein [Limisphaerales bacterium]
MVAFTVIIKKIGMTSTNSMAMTPATARSIAAGDNQVRYDYAHWKVWTDITVYFDGGFSAYVYDSDGNSYEVPVSVI